MMHHWKIANAHMRFLSWMIAMILLWVAAPLPAQSGQADRIPADTTLAVWVPDTGEVWQKAHALPLIQAIERYLNNPAITSDLDYQQFLLERDKMAQALGFPVTFDEFLGNIFNNASLYITPIQGGQTAGVLNLGVKDIAKAAKLIETIDIKNREAAALTADPSTTAPITKQTSIFEKIAIGGVDVSHFTKRNKSGKTVDSFYTLADGRLLYSNARSLIEQAIAGEPGAAGPLTSRSRSRLS